MIVIVYYSVPPRVIRAAGLKLHRALRARTASDLAGPDHPLACGDEETLRERIARDTVLGPNSPFRLQYVEPYAEAARTWLHEEAEVVDTTHTTPGQAAEQIAGAVTT